MTPEAYWARIRRIPLIPERDTSDGLSVICRAQDGTPVSVTKPEPYTDEEREAIVQTYETLYGRNLH